MLTITITPIGTKDTEPFVRHYSSSLWSMISIGWKVAKLVHSVYGGNIQSVKDPTCPDSVFYGVYKDKKFFAYIHILVEETPSMEDACPA